MFRDRLDAAHQLAERLRHTDGQNPLVLAIPRGGVPMGRVIAVALHGDLDVVLVHKIGAPANPEYAIGAVSEDGTVQLRDDAWERRYPQRIREEIDDQLAVLRQRRRQYTPVRPPIDPTDRVVIVVDDGSATGATMEAALTTLRNRAPRRLIAALGVAPAGVVTRLADIADEVVCVSSPSPFFAVGQHFIDFGQVSDAEVIACLQPPGDTGYD
ncbi:phosphoribosyltransferase [Arhodomonas sp. AD133]|uniref:phosphoribosyltransferase n=1 Tax=Arhodomonas sp. AD133 TaxID=3415009 RepID=UPI003EBC57CD